MKKLLGKLFLKLFGWKFIGEAPPEVHKQCVLIAAPHTTNWDYPFAVATMSALGVKIRYTIKKEWMHFPLRLFFGPMGGIGINRTPKNPGDKRPSMVEAIADLFNEHEKLCIMVPAEGTRSLRKQWKTGFYYIALTANVPIVLGYLDFEKKISGIGKVIYPTGNLEKDMGEIMEFYKDIKGKHPKKFMLDERFYPLRDSDSPAAKEIKENPTKPDNNHPPS
ncbi:MAG: acyltransferase [Aureispira sp.]|nr:acyltransferase [Aureispira sp.]